ncbi:812_t:CDS:2 [Cetraspora pellucida]|uniref:812_t:CDS:1 n=1 Tax=Cetraspora pellucida TaxID=1433469 RepID=A0A9N9HIG7_9GLOM|nr:812_t:CDS:2 [Cetraspora pellucida]
MNKKSAIDEKSSKKRHRFPLEDNKEFVSEAKDTRMQAATTITTTTDTSNSQISTYGITLLKELKKTTDTMRQLVVIVEKYRHEENQRN